MAEAAGLEAARLVVDLGAVHHGMTDLVGGKAASLGELIRAGLPVPEGFCVLTDAYALAAETAGLAPIVAELAGTAADRSARVAELAAEARRLLHTAPVPASVVTAVEDAYARLAGTEVGGVGAGVVVAVRSSATAEDLPHASFAGQQDTFLGVVGVAEVCEAARRCWASLWTERAVAYRAAAGIDHRAVRLAVVVQRLVDARVAGVMFTANPVTGRRRQAVVDASPGLGESVVSGSVDPDQFVVDLGSGRVESRRLGRKQTVVRLLPGGGTERVDVVAAESEACLDDDQLSALAALGRRVEAHYGSPQDTEWAVDAAGRLWLTQARPVTSLFPLPEGAPDPDDELRVYFCFSVAQGVERPTTPVGLAAFRQVASSAADMFGVIVADPNTGPRSYAEAGMRVFVDATKALRSKAGRHVASRVLDVMEARSAVVLRSLFDDPRLTVDGSSVRPVLRVARAFVRLRIPVRVLAALRDPDAALRRAHRFRDDVARLAELPTDATARDRLDHAVTLLRTRAVQAFPAVMPAAAAGFLALGVAARLLRDDAEPGELQAVLRGLPHNVTTEMDLALWQVASTIRADRHAAELLQQQDARELARRYREGGLPPVVTRALEEFLGRYGHRAVAEIDLGMPRWSDDPTHVLGVLANYLRFDDPDLAPDVQFARAASAAEEAAERLVAKARRRGRFRGAVVRHTLDRTRRLTGLRELPKSTIVQLLAGVRGQLLVVGAELASDGRLENADDVCFLDFEEIRVALDGVDQRRRIEERKEAYAHELRRRHVPRVLLSDGTEPEQARPVGTDGMSGTPASAGAVTARARVILDPVGARLEPGEILVAPSTDPGWTPLFLTAGGLVMEMGGANSHGAVVAREYGIPAVVGVSGAIDNLTTGQLVTVDGSAGTVRVASADVDEVGEDDDVVDVVTVGEGAAAGDQP